MSIYMFFTDKEREVHNSYGKLTRISRIALQCQNYGINNNGIVSFHMADMDCLSICSDTNGNFGVCISRVSNQNGISLQWYSVEIYHSGWKPSIYIYIYIWLIKIIWALALVCLFVGWLFFFHTGNFKVCIHMADKDHLSNCSCLLVGWLFFFLSFVLCCFMFMFIRSGFLQQVRSRHLLPLPPPPLPPPPQARPPLLGQDSQTLSHLHYSPHLSALQYYPL